MRQLILLISTLILVSCATLPAPEAPQNKTVAWDNRAQTLSSIQNWNLQGQIAIRNSKDAMTASLQWEQQPQRYKLSLLGPLGSGGMQLTGKPGFVQLKDSKGQLVTAPTPESLLAKQGWRVPVSNLFYWIRGLPVPNVPAEKQLDRYNHITQLAQQGWKIQYLRYSAVNKIDLPSKIFLDNPELNVKIIISQWHL